MKNSAATHADSIIYKKKLPSDYLLKTGDVLSVRIYTYNEEINQVLAIGSGQQQNIGGARGAENMYYSGYVVNDTGYIDIPVIGMLKVGGKSIADSRAMVQEKAEEYFDAPIVVIKTAGIQISCLGEFKSEGRTEILRERVDIYDAIAYAGGLTEYADKRNIRILRNEGGYYQEFLVDLTEVNTLSTEKFYVFNGDKIIADPVKTKIVRRNIQEFTFILSVISSTVTTTLLLLNLQK